MLLVLGGRLAAGVAACFALLATMLLTGYARRIGVAIGSGAVAVVLICALGVSSYGALAAAVASLISALIFNGRAISMALSKSAIAAGDARR